MVAQQSSKTFDDRLHPDLTGFGQRVQRNDARRARSMAA